MRKASVAIMMAFVLAAGVYADGYHLSVPNGWTKKSSAALAQYQNGTGTFILTVDTMPQKANTPDSYIEFVKEQLKGVFKEITFEPAVKGNKGKLETRELRYSVITYGMTLKYDVLYVFVKDKAYTLTSSNLAASIDRQFTSDRELFFSSFELE